MLFFTARYDLVPHIEAGKKARIDGWKKVVRSVASKKENQLRSDRRATAMRLG